MGKINRNAYKKHQWSAGKGRASESTLRHHHDTTSRRDAWRKAPEKTCDSTALAQKQNQPNLENPSSTSAVKPQVVICMAFAAAFLMVTALSITIGIFIGYSYCYLEHRSGVVKANLTRTNVQILHVPVQEPHDNKSRSINDAFLNNYVVAKFLRFSGLRDEPQWSEKAKLYVQTPESPEADF